MILHVLGVATHTIRHGENITGAMIHGTKRTEASDGIRSARPIVAVALLLVVGAWFTGLMRNFDAATQTTTLPLIGATLQIGEVEAGGGGAERERQDDGDED